MSKFKKPLAALSAVVPAVSLALSLSAAAPAAAAGWVSTHSHGFPLKAGIPTTAVPAAQPLRIAVSLNLRDKAGLQQYIAGQSRIGSRNYGQVMSSEQFNARHAPTLAQAEAVAAYLRSSGFSNVRVSGNRAVILADGTAAIAQAAFNTRLARFPVNGLPHFVNLTDIQVPASLDGLVLSVLGLNDLDRAATKLLKAARPVLTPTRNAGTPTLYGGYNAAQFQSYYNAGSTPTGAGTAVAIVSAGDDLSTVISDLRIAEARNGLPVVPVTVSQVVPLPSPQDTSGDGEWALDSQSATGIAGGVKQLIFYNTASLATADLLAATNQFAVDNIAKAGNMSYGGCEALNALLGGLDASDQTFMQAVAQGQTWFASSGDAGASCTVLINLGLPLSGPPDVEYPASSPYVVAVGGTTAITDADYGYVTEISWNGGGGGTSKFETAPAWQSGIVFGATLGLRGVPDIAMDADPNTGAEVITNGSPTIIGGTSLSSPLAAGVWARLQTAHCNALGFAAPMFYALDTGGGPLSSAIGFHDVQIGTNGSYVARPGWDYNTGFGTFDITAVNNALPVARCI